MPLDGDSGLASRFAWLTEEEASGAAGGWEGLTVCTSRNPTSPWGTVVADDGGKKVRVMVWDFWRVDEPTKLVRRQDICLWEPNKR
jgi:hypothetical protein